MLNEFKAVSPAEAAEAVRARIEQLLERQGRVIAAIDGRCASGKTTLAAELALALGGTVLHMDDFFLRPEQRTPERYAEPGGNVDRERFSEEVLAPLTRGEGFCYRPFDCRSMTLSEPVSLEPTGVTIVEGTYSCHPELWENYDLHIFLTTTPERQLLRLERRAPEKLEAFKTRWIPLEERYFSAYPIQARCELSFET